MPSIKQRLIEFARSPKGRQLTDQARQALDKPENRRRIEQLRSRLTNSTKRAKD
jgi:hypothetical protein